MGKVFEDYFSELQTDMVEICMEYVEDRAEKIYIYCSFEGGVQSCNFFYKVNGKVVKKSRLNDVIVDGQEEYDVSIPRQCDVMEILNEDMVALRKLCEEHQREMPTQIKLIYDVAANSLDADYSYDIIYSNHKNKMADDILEEWFESEKNKEKRGRSLWRKKTAGERGATKSISNRRDK